ncbi:MAG TPA: HNH endonuclease signature motif containing protein [Candidatus Krumholzibacteria bacterium]|nr:HNH endonuclease signature motif containing protein [Candidatus Krumholzibacteria bacterium]
MSNRLSGLTDHELLAGLQKLRGSERETTLEILRHLIEVERRKLHLKLGYPSMFVYCTEHLCYSESSAGRRVQSARCLVRFPQVELLLQRGEINLVTLGLVANLLTPQNVDWFMEKIRNKRQREVEAIVSAFRPASYLRDRVLRVSVPAPVSPMAISTPPAPLLNSSAPADAAASAASPAATGAPPANSAFPANASAPTEAESRPNENSVSPGPLLVNVGSNSHYGSEKSPSPVATVSKLYIQFLADDGFMRDYNQVCALLSNRLPRISFSSVFATVLRDYLERHSPQRRQERRDARQAAQEPPRLAEPSGEGENGRTVTVAEGRAHAAQPVSSRTPGRTQESVEKVSPRQTPRRPALSSQIRDAVFVRDQGRCTYVGVDGHRCGETLSLHIDHIQPVARNGTDELQNLRLLCSRHNQLEAGRVFGERRMRSYLDRQTAVRDPGENPT